MIRRFVALSLGTVSLSFSIAARADVVGECVKAAEDSQELRAKKKFVQARDRLQQCILPACPKEVRSDCKSWLNDIESSMGSIVIYAEDERGHSLVDVKVIIDDELIAERLDNNAVLLAPGPHVLKLETSGKPAVTQSFELKNGEKNRRVVVVMGTTQPSTTPSATSPVENGASKPATTKRISPAAWVLYGVGIGAVGAFAGLGVSGKSDVTTLRNTCAPKCASADVDSARMKLIGADISLGVAVLSMGIATYLVLNPYEVPAQSGAITRAPTSSLSIAPIPHGGFAAWGGIFLVARRKQLNSSPRRPPEAKVSRAFWLNERQRLSSICTLPWGRWPIRDLRRASARRDGHRAPRSASGCGGVFSNRRAETPARTVRNRPDLRFDVHRRSAVVRAHSPSERRAHSRRRGERRRVVHGDGVRPRRNAVATDCSVSPKRCRYLGADGGGDFVGRIAWPSCSA